MDLILSDLRLPDKDGIDLLKWLGEHGLQIPLIIMTGYADIQSAVQAMKLGACDYIAKPVNPDELLKKIGEALNASSSALKQMMHPSRTDDAFTPNRPSVSPKQTMHSDKMKISLRRVQKAHCLPPTSSKERATQPNNSTIM